MSESISREEEIRWLHFACTTAVYLWDDEAWEVLSVRHVQLARDAGALSELPWAPCSGVFHGKFFVSSAKSALSSWCRWRWVRMPPGITALVVIPSAA
jgi:hypothetical protein